jgi:hypothetical protein
MPSWVGRDLEEIQSKERRKECSGVQAIALHVRNVQSIPKHRKQYKPQYKIMQPDSCRILLYISPMSLAGRVFPTIDERKYVPKPARRSQFIHRNYYILHNRVAGGVSDVVRTEGLQRRLKLPTIRGLVLTNQKLTR